MEFCHDFATVDAFWDRFGSRGSFQNRESGLKSEEVPLPGA